MSLEPTKYHQDREIKSGWLRTIITVITITGSGMLVYGDMVRRFTQVEGVANAARVSTVENRVRIRTLENGLIEEKGGRANIEALMRDVAKSLDEINAWQKEHNREHKEDWKRRP